MEIPFADLRPMHDEIRADLDSAYKKVMDNSWFIQGKELEAFEKEFAEYVGVKHCIGVATGLDALYLVLKAYGIGAGDEVIVPSNTFIATALAVSYAGATPVFVEPVLCFIEELGMTLILAVSGAVLLLVLYKHEVGLLMKR